MRFVLEKVLCTYPSAVASHQPLENTDGSLSKSTFITEGRKGEGTAKNNNLSRAVAYGSSCMQRQTQRERQGRKTKEESVWLGGPETHRLNSSADREGTRRRCMRLETRPEQRPKLRNKNNADQLTQHLSGVMRVLHDRRGRRSIDEEEEMQPRAGKERIVMCSQHRLDDSCEPSH